MTTAVLRPLAEDDVAAWRAERTAAGEVFPEAGPGDRLEGVEVVLDGVAVGGAVLEHGDVDGRRRCGVRLLQTTLEAGSTDAWRAVVGAVVGHARTAGAALVTASVTPPYLAVWQGAGFAATMTGHSKRLDPDSAPELQEDRRVSVRPADDVERRRFGDDVRVQLRAGMAGAGVLVSPGAPMDVVEARLARLGSEPPAPEELVMVGEVDGVAVGRAWATLVRRDDGALDFLGNTIELFPAHRGQGLTPSFLGALRRHVRTLGVRDVILHVYGHDADARRTLTGAGAELDVVHLRLDLD